MKNTINRKLASKSQMETLLKISEQKNSPKDHYAIMTSLTTLDSTSASFEITKLSDKTIKYVTKKIFETNKMITEDPNWYLDNVLSETQKLEAIILKSRVKELQFALKHNNLDQAVVYYLDITQHDDHNLQIDSKILQLIQERIESYKPRVDEIQKLIGAI